MITRTCLVIAIIVVSVCACQSQRTLRQDDPVVIHKNSKLVVMNQEPVVKRGNKVVLVVTRHTGGSLKNDQGYLQEFWFEIPALPSKGQSETIPQDTYTGYLVRRCRCQDAGLNPIQSGDLNLSLSGTTLKVTGDFTATGRDSKEHYSFSISRKSTLR